MRLTKFTFNGTIEEWNTIEKERWNYGSYIKEVVCIDGTVTL